MLRTAVAPLTLAGVLALASAGCAPDGGQEGSDGTLGDVEITLELTHEIGSFDDPEQALTRLRTALLTPGGDLFVPQSEDAQVRRYDADGRLVATIGRRGEGPGELGSIGSLGLFGDTLWVHDGGNLAVHRFLLDGTHLETTSWPPATERLDGLLLVWGYGLNLRRDGRAVASPSISMRAGVRPDLEGYPISLIEPNGAVPSDTVLHATPGPFASPAPDGARELISIAPIAAAFRDGEGAFSIGGWGAEMAERADFRVFAVNVEGDTLFDRSYSYEPVPVDGDAARAEFWAGIDPAFRARFDDVELWLPEALPPVTAATDTSEGVIWLEREAYADPSTWWALDRSTGEVIATLELPAGEKVLEQLGDQIVTVFEDDFDVPYVRRYRIVR